MGILESNDRLTIYEQNIFTKNKTPNTQKIRSKFLENRSRRCSRFLTVTIYEFNRILNLFMAEQLRVDEDYNFLQRPKEEYIWTIYCCFKNIN